MKKSKLKVVADENINGLEYFDRIAEVSRVPGRSLSAQNVETADALLIRSVSVIGKELLENSAVKFIASATSGIDHVDLNYLQKNNIHFSHAPGSNANSVVQYVFASLAYLSEKYSFDWRELSIGIVGAGNVGNLLAQNLNKLGINFVIYDPYLNESHPFSNKFVSFETVLKQDVISVHTPLTKETLYPTWHMFDQAALKKMRKDSLIINTSRGAVFDNHAVDSEYQQHSWKCVFDVWENEPDIYMPLLRRVDIGTFHIAGYSFEGKEQGSAQVYQAFVDFFAIENALAYPINKDQKVLKAPDCQSELKQINQTILMAYDISSDHQEMLQLMKKTSATNFDALRKNYPLRREFQYFCLNDAGFNPGAKKVLRSLGFN